MTCIWYVNYIYMTWFAYLMTIIWLAGLCCNYSTLSTLHWRARWWLRRRISHFWPGQLVGSASSALLHMYFASPQFSQRSLQPLFGRHWGQPGFLQRLWGPSPSYLWHYGDKRNQEAVRTLSCPDSLRWQNRGPSWAGAALSVLSQR